MAQNKVQFQKGLSLPVFLEQFGTEEQCFTQLVNMRWPHGFQWPACGHNKYCLLNTRSLFQCNKCHHQASVKSNTLFEHSRLPLTKWFLGIYLVTQDKKGVSALNSHAFLPAAMERARNNFPFWLDLSPAAGVVKRIK